MADPAGAFAVDNDVEGEEDEVPEVQPDPPLNEQIPVPGEVGADGQAEEGAFSVDNDAEGEGDEVPQVQPAYGFGMTENLPGFGMTENLPQGDINWPSLDTWSQSLDLAHFDHGLTVELSGYSEAVNLPDVVIDDDPGATAQWLEDSNMVAGHDGAGADGNLVINQEGHDGANGNLVINLEGHDGADGNLVINLEGHDGADGNLVINLEGDGGDNEELAANNGGQANEEPPGGNIFDLGLQHLRNNDVRVMALIDAHPQLPAFNGQNMTTFQRLTRALIEEGGSVASRPTRYHDLGILCQNNVNPVTVAALDNQQLVQIGVQGELKAQAIINFAGSFGNYNDNEIDELLNLTDANLYRRFYLVNGIGPFYAQYMLIFGMRRLDYMPAHVLALTRRVELHYHGHAAVNFELWNPYRGLAAWLIWTYVQLHGG